MKWFDINSDNFANKNQKMMLYALTHLFISIGTYK